MFDILFVRTFSIVGGMLLVTAAVSALNKDVIVGKIASFLISLAILFAAMAFRNDYPVNILLMVVFSAWIGWMLGPLMNMISQNGQGNAITQALVCTAAATVGT
ncbi:MAG: Bax inhibitor-1 family protein [Patescibacteria group bacterium]